MAVSMADSGWRRGLGEDVWVGLLGRECLKEIGI